MDILPRPPQRCDCSALLLRCYHLVEGHLGAETRPVKLVTVWGEEDCPGFGGRRDLRRDAENWERARGSLSAGSAGRERDSCSVYGTGRIHCEQSRSVNYRRAINRAETDPRVSREHSSPPGPRGGPRHRKWACFGAGKVGARGYALWYVPSGPATLAICLADFGTSTFLLVSLRSEQSCAVPIWEKRDCSRVPPPLRLASAPQRLHLAQLPPGPRSPVGSQIALHRLGPQQSWKPGNPSWASRWGRLQPWREVGGGVHHL